MKTVKRFTAAWCGPCKTLGPIMQELAQKYSDKAVFQIIDVDSDPESAKAYGISSIPVVVIEENGVVISRIIGLKPKSTYETAIISS